MLGTLRFILASLVALSHIGWLPLGFNPGIAAVVVFYMISGYVVTRLWFRLQKQPSPQSLFYRDRFIRIYPTYLFVLLVGVTVYFLMAPETYYLSAEPGWGAFAENLTVIPLNYFMFNGSDRFVFIPPAWSLAAELQFYLLLPLLVRFPGIVFGLSLMVAVAAQTGLIPREWFTYRLLPGALHIFMAGALLAGARNEAQLRARAIGLWLIYAVLFAVLTLRGELFMHREPELYVLGMLNVAPELFAGLLIGMPALVLLAFRRSGRLDQRLGDLSYGVFLNHFIVYWLLESWGYAPMSGVNVIFFMGLSVALAVVGWRFVERPCKSWRYGLRVQG